MKIRAIRGVSVCAPLAVLALGSTAHAGLTGWERSSNWVPGIVQGSSANNPGHVGGQPIWQYEVVQGGGLGSANPWYAEPGQLMTWDTAWYQTGWGVWSNGNDLNPPILAGRLIHNVHPTVYNDIPLVRWMSPLGNGSHVSIAGTMTVNWNGVNGLGRPVDVDVVIAKISGGEGTPTILYSTTVSKPNPFPSVGDSISLPVSLSNISLDAGESIVFSHRGHHAVGPLGAWVNLYDSLVITPVPAPASAGLLALGGVLAARRRRS